MAFHLTTVAEVARTGTNRVRFPFKLRGCRLTPAVEVVWGG